MTTSLQPGIDREIINQIYIALELLGAKMDLLTIIGSWYEPTMSKDDVLLDLRAWNNATLEELK